MFLIPQQERYFPFYCMVLIAAIQQKLLYHPRKSLGPTDVSDYREKLVLSLSSARALAKKANTKAQNRQKAQYDKQAVSPKLKVGDWVLCRKGKITWGKHRFHFS